MKSERVQQWIRDAIASGTLKKGQRLPSCREIASLLGVNKITVNQAFHALEEELLVYGVPRGGFYVAEGPKTKTLQPLYDFKTVAPDPSMIPHRELAHVFQKAMANYKDELYLYESPAGLATLRDALKTTFEEEGIYTKPEHMVITNGAQQALYVLLQSLFPPSPSSCSEPGSCSGSGSGKLLVESPTYSLVLQMAEQLHIEVTTLPRTQAGYDLKQLENLMKDPDLKAFYLMPRHHNPTGFSLSEKQKQAVTKLASQYKVLLIEDDYLADLGTKKGAMPLFYYDTAGTTAYIRSFSKAFMPGIRMGIAILPPYYVANFTKIKHLSDLNTSKLPQSALEGFLRSGMYQRHLKKVRKCYDEKLRRAMDILNHRALSSVTWHVPDHGIFIWGELKSGHRASQIAKTLEQQGILVATGCDAFFEKNDRHLRLCVSGIEIDTMKSGLALLLRVLEEEAKVLP